MNNIICIYISVISYILCFILVSFVLNKMKIQIDLLLMYELLF